ncbi:MAG: restriction endonuclease [Sterolibacterium sp.]|jgi:hypothetical protein
MDKLQQQARKVIHTLLETTVAVDAMGFERLVLMLLTLDGSEGTLTPASGDNGVDVEVRSSDGLLIAQCKAYSQDIKVTPREVREFLGAVFHSKASKGYFFTTSSFTDQARSFAAENPVLELVDRVSLTEWIANAAIGKVGIALRHIEVADDDHSRAARLRRTANAMRSLAEHGKLDEALELIYDWAKELESLDVELKRPAWFVAQQSDIEENLNRISQLESERDELNGKLASNLGRLAFLETNYEADYVEDHAGKLAASYEKLGVPIADVIEIMRDQHVQVASGGWWLIDRRESDSEWLPHKVIQGRRLSPEEYPADSFVYIHRLGCSDWNWIIVNRRTHEPVACFREWTRRETAVKEARQLITDEQLVEFFRASLGTGRPPRASGAVNRHLDAGANVDSIFYTGSDYGYNLSVKKSGSTLHISFGCVAGPEAGDGGHWVVTLDDRGHVETVDGGVSWIS